MSLSSNSIMRRFAAELDGLEIRIKRLQGNPGMTPDVAIPDFLTCVAFDGVTFPSFGIGSITKLYEHGPCRVPVTGALNRQYEPSGMAGSMDLPTTCATNMPLLS